MRCIGEDRYNIIRVERNNPDEVEDYLHGASLNIKNDYRFLPLYHTSGWFWEVTALHEVEAKNFISWFIQNDIENVSSAESARIRRIKDEEYSRNKPDIEF